MLIIIASIAITFLLINACYFIYYRFFYEIRNPILKKLLENNEIVIFGHRGGSLEYPENSLDSL